MQEDTACAKLCCAVAVSAFMQVRKAPALAILFPLPPKPLGDVPADVPNRDRDNMAMQQYMGPLKFQKMAAWLTAMSTLTGACVGWLVMTFAVLCWEPCPFARHATHHACTSTAHSPCRVAWSRRDRTQHAPLHAHTSEPRTPHHTTPKTALCAGMAYKVHAGATQGPAPEDFEVRSQLQLQAACYNKPGLCLLALLDGRSTELNKHRDAIKAAAGALPGQPVNWVVVDVAQQPSFRRAYGFTSDQLPALVALSTRRMRFAQGAAPFGEDSAKQLVTKVLTGAAVTLPLPVRAFERADVRLLVCSTLLRPPPAHKHPATCARRRPTNTLPSCLLWPPPQGLPALVDGGEGVPEDAGKVAVAEEFRLDDIMAEEVQSMFSKEARLKQAEEEVQREVAAKKKKQKSKKKSKKKKRGNGAKKQQQQHNKAGSKDEL